MWSHSLQPVGPLKDILTYVEVTNISKKHSTKSVTKGKQHPECGVLKLAFSVPDLSACVSRLREYGVEILKEAGTFDGREVVAQALGFESPNIGRNKGIWDFIHGVAFARDPDGYVLELIQY